MIDSKTAQYILGLAVLVQTALIAIFAPLGAGGAFAAVIVYTIMFAAFFFITRPTTGFYK
jgi:hypothetical protein